MKLYRRASKWRMPDRSLRFLRPLMVLLLSSAVSIPSGASAQMDYTFGACSRVVIEGCEECVPQIETLEGGFSLSPDSDAESGSEVLTYAIRDLILSAEHIDISGFGMLVVDGTRASLLGVLGLDGRDVFFSGSGTVAGDFPFAVHIDHLVVDSLRFDLYGVPSIYPDQDGDAVGDVDDECPMTPCGARVDVGGCALEQWCPCEEQADGVPWGSHREYVRCVISASRDFLTSGRVDAQGRSEIVKTAAQSSCGRSILAGLFDTW